MTRPRKNPSARDKRLAQDRARREQARLRTDPLLYSPPPFQAYREVIAVPDAGLDHPVLQDPDVSAEGKDLIRRAIKLAAHYGPQIPIAAIHLDLQLERGEVTMPVFDDPALFRSVRVAEVAAAVSDPDHVARLQRRYPGLEIADASPTTGDDVAATLHAVHRKGAIVLDDDLVLRMAFPPARPGGQWRVHGYQWGV